MRLVFENIGDWYGAFPKDAVGGRFVPEGVSFMTEEKSCGIRVDLQYEVGAVGKVDGDEAVEVAWKVLHSRYVESQRLEYGIDLLLESAGLWSGGGCGQTV